MKFRNTLTAGLALLAGLAGAPAAWAIEGYAHPWQIGLQPANSASMGGIHTLHNDLLLPIITVVVLVVLGLLLYVTNVVASLFGAPSFAIGGRGTT